MRVTWQRHNFHLLKNVETPPRFRKKKNESYKFCRSGEVQSSKPTHLIQELPWQRQLSKSDPGAKPLPGHPDALNQERVHYSGNREAGRGGVYGKVKMGAAG